MERDAFLNSKQKCKIKCKSRWGAKKYTFNKVAPRHVLKAVAQGKTPHETRRFCMSPLDENNKPQERVLFGLSRWKKTLSRPRMRCKTTTVDNEFFQDVPYF